MHCDIMQYSAIQYNTMKYSTMQYNAIQYNANNAIQYNSTCPIVLSRQYTTEFDISPVFALCFDV